MVDTILNSRARINIQTALMPLLFNGALRVSILLPSTALGLSYALHTTVQNYSFSRRSVVWEGLDMKLITLR